VSEVEKTADGYSAAVFYKYFETAYFALPNKELVPSGERATIDEETRKSGIGYCSNHLDTCSNKKDEVSLFCSYQHIQTKANLAKASDAKL
jgi:hypothetical protein